MTLVLLVISLTPQAHSSDKSYQVAESCKKEEVVSEWPSFAKGVVCTFIRDKDDLQILHSLMSKVDFSPVVKHGEEHVFGYNSPGEGKPAVEALPNSDQWLGLMNKTQIQVLTRSEKATVLSPLPIESPSDRMDTLYYLTGDFPVAKKCVEQFQDVPCGTCDLARVDGWSIRYAWSSGPHVKKYFQPPSESAAAESTPESTEARDRFDEFHKTNFECLRRGLEEMEYENPADFF